MTSKTNSSSSNKENYPKTPSLLSIDGYHCEIRDNSKVKQATCYVVLGIDLEGKKDIFGIYTFFGKENKADWMKVFEDLITRGLKKVLIIVSDDFPGIIDAVKIAYPYADHQLCFVHLQRNVKRHMTKEDSSKFNKELERIRLSSSDIDEAVSAFNQLCNEYLSKYPRFLKGILEKAEYYFAHIRYPEEIRKHIYTTNAVESINSIIEKIRMKSGGYFQSTEILEKFAFKERTLSVVNGKMGYLLLNTTLTKSYNFSNYAMNWIHKILDKSRFLYKFTCLLYHLLTYLV